MPPPQFPPDHLKFSENPHLAKMIVQMLEQRRIRMEARDQMEAEKTPEPSTLEQQFKDLQEELEKTKIELTASQMKNDEMKKNFKSKTEKLQKKLEKERKEHEETKSQLNAALHPTDISKQLQTLTDALESQKIENSEKFRALEDQISRSFNAQQSDIISKIIGDLQAQNIDLQLARNDNKEWKEIIDRLESEKFDLEEFLKKKDTDINRLEYVKFDFEHLLKRRDKEILELEQRVEIQKKEISRNETEKKKMVSEMTHAQLREKRITAYSDKAEEDLKEANKELEKVKARLEWHERYN